jgi:SAM-dependent methyltransferase
MLQTERSLTRMTNGLRKLAAGLRPFGKSVWPGVRTDLFVAHQSVYEFLLGLAPGTRVLDVGCGTGYGSFRLAHNAALVVGIDIDPISIGYARRRFRRRNLRYEVRDALDLSRTGGEYDLVTASNVLEHMSDPEHFLDTVRNVLTLGGTLIAVIAPLWTERDLAWHNAVEHHRSNLAIDHWLHLFRTCGWSAELFRHDVAGHGAIDFTSPFESGLQVSDFVFEPTDRDDLYERPCLSVCYLLRRA